MIMTMGGPGNDGNFRVDGKDYLDAMIVANSGSDSATLFRMCWRWILNNKEHFSASMRNRFSTDWTIIAFMRFAPVFKEIRPDFVVEILSSGNAPPEYRSGEGCILLSFHTSIERAICTQLDRHGYAVSIIAAPRGRVPHGSKTNLRGGGKGLFPMTRSLEVIRRGVMCLAEAHDRARKGAAVVINADYTVLDPQNSCYDIRISRRLLNFVLVSRLPAYWVLPSITAEGQVLLDFHKMDLTLRTPEALLHAMRKITTDRNYNFMKYTLGDWWLETSGRSNAVRGD